jgi:hypothetical protein
MRSGWWVSSAFCVGAFSLSLVLSLANAEQKKSAVWTFETDAADQAPGGFSFGRTGSGAQGRWSVRQEKGAPSGGKVLAQLDADATSFRFPVAAADASSARDGAVSVRCKMVSGKVDQACGIVWRYQDENNYYIARANVLENNVRFYTVKDGKRNQLESWSGKVTKEDWHTLRAEFNGAQVRVLWDGKQVIEAKDSTFTAAGKVGVWTKADSVTLFDDLRLEAQ